MDLYAYRGIQQLISLQAEGQRIFSLVFWGITLIMLLVLIWAGSRFQQMRDPSRFFGVMLIMGIFLMLYLPKLVFNSTQLLSDLTLLLSRLLKQESSLLRRYLLIFGAAIGVFLFFAFAILLSTCWIVTV